MPRPLLSRLRGRLLLLVALTTLPAFALSWYTGWETPVESRHVLALLMVMALTLAAAWFAAERFVLRRVSSLIDATRKLAAGDLAARTELPYGHSELSELARSFDEMASALERRQAERDLAEQALRDSEERFRAFMDNSPAIAFVRTEDGELVWANATLERYFALEPGAWRSQPGSRFWSPDLAEQFGREDAQVLSTGAPQHWVGTVVLADGRRRHWLTVKFPLSDADGRRMVATMSVDMSEWRQAQEELAQAERRCTQLVEQASDAVAMADADLQAIVRDVSARHDAEQALRQSEERFRLLYQYLPLAYHSLSEHGTIVMVNDAWLALTGLTRGRAVGRRFADLLAADSLDVYESRFRRTIGASDVHDVEVTLIRGDRARVTVSIDGRRGQDEHGEIRIHCALHDVTAARQADARVRRSEERYRTLFDESPISLWEEDFSGIRRHLDRLRALGVTDFREHFEAHPEELADCIGAVKVVDVNRATLALYGADSRSQLLAGLDRIIGEDGRDVFRRSVLALASGERSWKEEGINYTLSSEPIRLALHWSVAPGAERSWSRVLVSAVDITDRIRVEDALRESEARFQRVLRSAPVAMGISRRSDGVILDVNDVFLRELGFKRQEVIGRTPADLGIWSRPEGPEEMLSDIDQQGAIQGQDIRLRRRSGGFFEGVLSVVPLRVHGEDCLLLQAVDTTALRRAEELNRESQRRVAALMNNIPGMVYRCCVDSEWTMLFVSDGCRELTGYEPSDLVGNRTLSYGSLIVEEDREMVLSAVRDATDRGQPFRLRYRIRHAAGGTRWVSERGRVAESSSDQALVLEGFIFDVTESRRDGR